MPDGLDAEAVGEVVADIAEDIIEEHNERVVAAESVNEALIAAALESEIIRRVEEIRTASALELAASLERLSECERKIAEMAAREVETLALLSSIQTPSSPPQSVVVVDGLENPEPLEPEILEAPPEPEPPPQNQAPRKKRHLI